MMTESSLTADQAQIFTKVTTTPEEENMEPTACSWPPRGDLAQTPKG